MKYTVNDFHEQFKTDAECLDFIFKTRFPDGGKCGCGKVDCFYPVTGRRCYACSWCGRQISPTAGTIFHKSETSLKLWFFAIFLMSSSKNGVAAMELKRQLGVTYKTAWRMAHQIRKLMDVSGGKLSGVVEVDETYIGGLSKNMHIKKRAEKEIKTGPHSKTAVLGLVQREGEVRAKVIEETGKWVLVPEVMDHVAQGSTVCTDEWKGYNLIGRVGYVHARVNHREGEYVRAIAHTNTIEGFWSQLKRSINGTFHHVSKRHLQKYVNEFCYRYNRRKSERPVFADLSARVGVQRA